MTHLGALLPYAAYGHNCAVGCNACRTAAARRQEWGQRMPRGSGLTGRTPLQHIYAPQPLELTVPAADGQQA